ncbi:hypothetical protein [Streptomyces sp. 8P21H-1]|uniref:hypothetical protein n=1 Tax=Streptomyces sp. 8P21H-1 TaxID=2737048 RepID=UPI001C2DC2F5|nr:hypothetical protein [Streptomyces sp. 8P21H-1]NSL42705.1 hypothetical protein [Streptomyces sp. 8P21H-1]
MLDVSLLSQRLQEIQTRVRHKLDTEQWQRRYALRAEGDVASMAVGISGAGEPVFARPAGTFGKQHR